MSRVTWRGVTVDSRTAAMLTELAKISGPILIHPTQGSYNRGGVAASAGTHDGGGAVDLMHSSWKVADYNKVVELARKIGFAAWHRTPQQSNWPRHVHMIAIQPGGKGDQGVLSRGAHDQVKAYYENRNGLASRRPDDATRKYVGVTWEKYKAGRSAPAPKVEEAPVAGSWHKYSGKSPGTLRLPGNGRYVTLDATIPACPKGGVKEDRMVYLNVGGINWERSTSDPLYYFQTAVLRVRWVRDPHGRQKADPTAYTDYVITPWRKEALITHLHWEVSEKGRGGKWHVSLVGHAKSVALGTRYAKGFA